MRELDPLISEYQHDKNKPRESEALFTLRKVASLVKPIMRQRGWRVGILCEMYPKERHLLGLNYDHGRKICLRLRHPSDERQFLGLEEVVDTMLHELCHNNIGPHNSEFHKLWDQLRDEYTTLKIRGYTGEGFLSEGKRLGGRRIPMDEARRLARANAEKRRGLYAGSGQKVGGAPVKRGADIRKIIADAAQRRIEVTRGCVSETDQTSKLADEISQNGFRTKAEEEDANEQAIMQAYIELLQEEEREKYGESYIPPSQELPAGPRTTLSPPPVPEGSKPMLPTPARSSSTPQGPSGQISNNASYDQPWTCPICTLENPPAYLCCDACTTERPVPSSMKPSSDSSSKGKTAEHPGRNPKRRGKVSRSDLWGGYAINAEPSWNPSGGLVQVVEQ
ncbi:hypothetical protein DTO169C6_72 [Paecilomyces variotii]|nr:hypothetical protein DTO169C6_72 [Paecilomyces variotii]